MSIIHYKEYTERLSWSNEV